ncbi:hypothetical protein F4779DRAFT_435158 [Xylariaceae sp. FL0662B]|nr:hypothetical protein F4779DRAFT_435158 [Xylariaceae sp. FL0662B]
MNDGAPLSATAQRTAAGLRHEVPDNSSHDFLDTISPCSLERQRIELLHSQKNFWQKLMTGVVKMCEFEGPPHLKNSGHSLGGIVIKKALIIAHARQNQWGDLLRSAVHLCFFGTPHHGTDSVVDLLLNFGDKILGANDSSVRQELRLWSKPLIDSNALFIDIAEGFTITSFFEKKKYHGVLLVDEGSTRLNKGKEQVLGLDKHHLSMCKFSDLEDPNYLTVFGRLHAEISTIGTEEQTKEHEQLVERLLTLAPHPPTSV